MEVKSVAYEHLQRAGDIADGAVAEFYHGEASGPEKINRVIEALALISQERADYEKIIGREAL